MRRERQEREPTGADSLAMSANAFIDCLLRLTLLIDESFPGCSIGDFHPDKRVEFAADSPREVRRRYIGGKGGRGARRADYPACGSAGASPSQFNQPIEDSCHGYRPPADAEERVYRHRQSNQRRRFAGRHRRPVYARDHYYVSAADFRTVWSGSRRRSAKAGRSLSTISGGRSVRSAAGAGPLQKAC